jgi:hypothetical protein
MKVRFPHRSAVVPGRPAGDPAGKAAPLTFADRACCCPARPVVTVVMPPSAARPHPVDLLLCGHHYRACAAALAAAGATVYDETGAPAGPGSGGRGLAHPLPARAAPLVAEE